MSRGFGESRPMLAINRDTGVSFTTDSVCEMANIEFGLDDYCSLMKVQYRAKNGKPTPNGNFLYYIGDPTGLSIPTNVLRERPVLRLDIITGTMIQYYNSVGNAAQYVRDMELCGEETSKSKVSCYIVRCCKGHQGCRSAYGFKWRYVRHDEPPENVPLPEPNYEGL